MSDGKEVSGPKWRVSAPVQNAWLVKFVAEIDAHARIVRAANIHHRPHNINVETDTTPPTIAVFRDETQN